MFRRSFLNRLIQLHAMDSKQSKYFTKTRQLKIEYESNEITNDDKGIKTRSKTKPAGEIAPNEKRTKRSKKDILCPEIKEMKAVKSESVQPENWEQILDSIRSMRRERDAPVDLLGAEQCSDKDCPPQVYRFSM